MGGAAFTEPIYVFFFRTDDTSFGLGEYVCHEDEVFAVRERFKTQAVSELPLIAECADAFIGYVFVYGCVELNFLGP